MEAGGDTGVAGLEAGLEDEANEADEVGAGPGGVSVSRNDAEPPGETESENGFTLHSCSATGLKICSKDSFAEGVGAVTGNAITLLVPRTASEEDAFASVVEVASAASPDPAAVLDAPEI